MATEYETTMGVERDDTEIDLVVRGTVSKFTPARLYGPSEDCYPAEGGEVEITEVLCNSVPWTGTLTPGEITTAEDRLVEESTQSRYYHDED
jgi:hypothetical protein